MEVHKKILLASVIILAALIGVVWWQSAHTEFMYPRSGETVVFFGDSLVAGVGAESGYDMPTQLSNRLTTEVINAGKSGDTTATALHRLDVDVLDKNPRVVLVLVGGNDALRRIPREQTRENLEQIIDRITQTGAAVILIGVQGSLLGDVYEDMFEEVASEHGANYISNILQGVFGEPSLMHDAIHPNSEGYTLMVDRIEPVLRALLLPQT